MGGPLQAEDIDVRLNEETHTWEAVRKSDGKLLCSVRETSPHTVDPLPDEWIAAARNAALTEGMELGRRMLQEELRDLLGVK
jgi:hypothetical protein